MINEKKYEKKLAYMPLIESNIRDLPFSLSLVDHSSITPIPYPESTT